MTLPGDDRDERGFVTVAVAGLMAVLLAVTGAVALLGAVAVARHRAATAADLAALAAAEPRAGGPAAGLPSRPGASPRRTVRGCPGASCSAATRRWRSGCRRQRPVGRWGHARASRASRSGAVTACDLPGKPSQTAPARVVLA